MGPEGPRHGIRVLRSGKGDPARVREGATPTSVRLNEPNPLRQCACRGNISKSPRVTDVYDLDKLTTRFAGLSAKRPDPHSVMTPESQWKVTT
jgi:hypothetical protein